MPRILVTGDSMVEPMDRQLRAELSGQARVRRDPRPGTSISRTFPLNWMRHAEDQAARHRPDATVVFIGANDGWYRLRTPSGRRVKCCGKAWIEAFARRVSRMMRAYRRDGQGRVYWVTLPTPRDRARKRRFTAINAALRRARRAVGDGARLVPIHRTLSPRNRYRKYLQVDGRRVRVRDRDGVHLTAAGSRIALGLVLDRLRRDGLSGAQAARRSRSR